jgi:hypothetical protein
MCLSVFRSLYYLLLFIYLSLFIVPIPPLPPQNSHRPWSAAADGVEESEATQPREKEKENERVGGKENERGNAIDETLHPPPF